MRLQEKAPIHVDDELIRLSCKTLDDAVRMCLHVSGRSMQEVAWDCGWRDGGRMLKRILSASLEGADKRYMPHEKWVPYMVACRNVVPLRFVAIKVAAEFVKQGVMSMASVDSGASEEMRILRVMLGEIQDEVRALRGVRDREGTQFSLCGPVGIPGWMICEVERVQAIVTV